MTNQKKFIPYIKEGEVRKGNVIGPPTTPKPNIKFQPFGSKIVPSSSDSGNSQPVNNNEATQTVKK